MLTLCNAWLVWSGVEAGAMMRYYGAISELADCSCCVSRAESAGWLYV